MKYSDIFHLSSIPQDQLLLFTRSNSMEEAPTSDLPLLPAPPMLMIDRVTSIVHAGTKGSIVAERDVRLDDWFFQCHFRDDPVQPGCLGVDAIWQLLGLYCGLRGARGAGRALGCKEVEFFGQIRPHDKVVRYEVEIRRYTALERAALVIGSAKVLVDDQHIYTIQGAKVGMFPGIRYPDYPLPSENSRGGVMIHDQE